MQWFSHYESVPLTHTYMHAHKVPCLFFFFLSCTKAIFLFENVSLWINIYSLWLCASISDWMFELPKSILPFAIDGNITYLFWILYSLHTGTGEGERWIILCIIFSLKAHSLESTRKKVPAMKWNHIPSPLLSLLNFMTWNTLSKNTGTHFRKYLTMGTE